VVTPRGVMSLIYIPSQIQNVTIWHRKTLSITAVVDLRNRGSQVRILLGKPGLLNKGEYRLESYIWSAIY